MQLVNKIKDGAKKTWGWIKKHPGETCLMVGSAIIGGVTGSKIGKHRGYKEGHRNGWNDQADIRWRGHCQTYGFDPEYSHVKFTSMDGRHQTAAKWAEALANVDPERKLSGKLAYDDTVVQDNEPAGDETPW